MKIVRYNSHGFHDMFGIVTLRPGENTLTDEQWAKVRPLRLGDMTEPYVEWARSRGVLTYDDDVERAPKVLEPQGFTVPTAPAEPSVAVFNEEAKTLEVAGEILEVIDGPILGDGVMDPDSPAMADDAAPVADVTALVPDAGAATPPKPRRGRPPKAKS